MSLLSPPAVETVGAEVASTSSSSRMRTLLTLLGIPVLVFVTRLPFLSAGYGMDPDAWRVATIAHYLAHSGVYVASRLPGYPVQEFVSSLLSRGGPLALNPATAFCSALAVFFFILILRTLGCRDALLAGFALACLPVVYISSTISMDYIWALAFLLGATYMTLGRRPWLAGIFLGAGDRVSHHLHAVPLAAIPGHRLPGGPAGGSKPRGRRTPLPEVDEAKPAATAGAEAIKPAVMLSEDMSSEEEAEEDEDEEPMDPALRMCIMFTLVTLAVGAFCFLPVLLNYGLGFFQLLSRFAAELYPLPPCHHRYLGRAGLCRAAAGAGLATGAGVPARAQVIHCAAGAPLLLAWIIVLALTACSLYFRPGSGDVPDPLPAIRIAVAGIFAAAPHLSSVLRGIDHLTVPVHAAQPARTLRDLVPPGSSSWHQDFRVYLIGPILDDHHLRVAQDHYLRKTLAFSDSQPTRCWLIMLGMLAELNMVSLEHGGNMISFSNALLHAEGRFPRNSLPVCEPTSERHLYRGDG